MDVDAAAAGSFLRELLGQPIVAEPAGAGMWSRCFGYEHEGERRVARFGVHRNDFECDRFAAGFVRPGLPIPRVHAIGEAFDGYYAISDRADGEPLEHVPLGQWRSLVPALAAAMEALRSVDPPEGWGGWSSDGVGEQMGWREHLLAVADDGADDRQRGQMASLATHAEAKACFDWGFALLDELASDDVPRSVLHCDLINRNVHVVGDTITGIFDWGCGRYGDSLYEIAWFDFWSPWHTNLDVDLLVDATDLPVGGDRHLACLLHIGLDHLGYHAVHGDDRSLTETANRTRAVVARFG